MCIRDSSSHDSKAWAFHNLGKIQQLNKNWIAAKDHYLKCLELTTLDKYDVLTCETYLKLCELYLTQQNYDEAENFGLKALKLSENINAKENNKTALLLLSEI